MSKAVIDIQGLRVEREAVILECIDWRVEAGEHWVILGANGSGKTSLLSTMTGYLPLTQGSISVLGETYGKTDWRDLRTRIGIVSSAIQQLMPGHETALDGIISGKRAMIGLWGDTAADDRSRALEILRQIEADAIADGSVATLKTVTEDAPRGTGRRGLRPPDRTADRRTDSVCEHRGG